MEWLPKKRWVIESLPNEGWIASREDGLKIAEKNISNLIIILKNAENLY
jgi:hypothetical protein